MTRQPYWITYKPLPFTTNFTSYTYLEGPVHPFKDKRIWTLTYVPTDGIFLNDLEHK